MNPAVEHAEVVEAEREDRVRTLACPRCGAPPQTRCRPIVVTTHKGAPSRACTGRYNAAAAAGLVPALPPTPAA